jgi:hypothetical protein
MKNKVGFKRIVGLKKESGQRKLTARDKRGSRKIDLIRTKAGKKSVAAST